MTIAVLIADDHPLFRRGLRDVIEEGGRFRVTAEAGDGETAIRQIEHSAPSVAFIDLAMPVKDGLAVAAWNAQAASPTRIVIMTLHKERDFVDRAVQLGAAGYLVKDDAQGEVLRCLDLVLQGQVGSPRLPIEEGRVAEAEGRQRGVGGQRSHRTDVHGPGLVHRQGGHLHD